VPRVTDDKAQDAFGGGAAGDADAALARAAADVEGEHAVQAHRGKHQCDDADRADQRSARAQGERRRFDLRDIGREFEKEHPRLERENLAAHRGDELFFRQRAAQDEAVAAGGLLVERQVYEGPRRLADAAHGVGGRDADDLDNRAIRRPHAQAFADRAFVRPVAARHDFVDDRYARRTRAVTLVEVAAFDDADVHRVEVVTVDLRDVEAEAVLAGQVG